MAFDDSSTMLPNNQKPKKGLTIFGGGKLPEGAIFDKVINVAIHRKGMEDIVIRSDYELTIEKGLGTYSINKCCYKPQVRLSMNAVTSNLATEIDLYITNLFVFTNEGNNSLMDFTKESVFGKKGSPITGIDIILGYAAQFTKPLTADEYFTVDANKVPYGATGIKITNITYATFDKAPPDAVIHFHGFVGGISKGLGTNTVTKGVVSLMDLKKKEDITVNNKIIAGRTLAERLFHFLIERRFVRDEQAWDSLTEIERKAYLDKDGFLTKKGVKDHGCNIIIPEGSSILDPKKFKITQYKGADGSYKDIDVVDYFGASYSVEATLIWIKDKFFSSLQWAPLLNGNYVVWANEDLNPTNARQERDFLKMQKTLDALNKVASNNLPGNDPKAKGSANILSEEIVIPAVYAVTASAGICSIKCPFFAMVNPFQKLTYNSRYDLANFSNFFGRTTSNVLHFYSIGWSLDFSTTGRENNMVIQTVGLDY